MHQFLGTTPSSRRSPRAWRRDPRPPPGACRSERPDRREPEARRDRHPHGRLRLRDREDERFPRARSWRARARPSRLRADRPDRDRDRGLGDRGGCRRGGLHRGRGRAPGRRGRRPGQPPLGRGPGLARPPGYSGVTLGLFHGSVPHYLVLCHQVGDEHIQDLPAHPIPSLPELIGSTSASRSPPGPQRSWRLP